MLLRGAHFGSQACVQDVRAYSSYENHVPRSDLPTGVRMSFFLMAWEIKTSDIWTLSIMRSGYRIQLRVLPVSSKVVYSYATGSYQDGHFEGRSSFLTSKQATEEVKDFHPTRGFYSRIFLVQKRSGGWRPVIDLSHLNQFVLCLISKWRH